MNRPIVYKWGIEQPHAQTEHQCDSPKVNVSFAVLREKMHAPLFFPEATVTGDSLLDMLENWLLPQLNTNYDGYFLQLDGAPHSCTGMYESFSFVFFNSAGSEVLQKRPRTSPLDTTFAGSNNTRIVSLGVR